MRKSGGRVLKEYVLTEDELSSLAQLGWVATLCFSLATFCGALWFDVSKDIDMAGAVPATTLAYWSAIRGISGGAALFLAALGAAMLWFGHSKVSAIKRDTMHDE